MTWVTKWDVPSRSSSAVYTVSRDQNGRWGCGCPAWRFRRGARGDCKHIKEIQMQLASQPVAVAPPSAVAPSKPTRRGRSRRAVEVALPKEQYTAAPTTSIEPGIADLLAGFGED